MGSLLSVAGVGHLNSDCPCSLTHPEDQADADDDTRPHHPLPRLLPSPHALTQHPPRRGWTQMLRKKVPGTWVLMLRLISRPHVT